RACHQAGSTVLRKTVYWPRLAERARHSQRRYRANRAAFSPHAAPHRQTQGCDGSSPSRTSPCRANPVCRRGRFSEPTPGAKPGRHKSCNNGSSYVLPRSVGETALVSGVFFCIVSFDCRLHDRLIDTLYAYQALALFSTYHAYTLRIAS